uniref:Odorant receptor n=1 Tax=Anopheles maculatus TaxID=74869 RepID=A0A182SGM2_9DIPT
MEAAKKFHQYERYLRTLCNVLGFDVVSKGWKKTYRTYVTIFLCGQYFLWMVWSIIIASDTFELLKSLSFIGFFFQCSSKMYYTITNAPHYSNNFAGLQESIYTAHMDGTEEQKTVIERVITVVLLATKATTVLFTSSLFIFSFYPAYMYFVMDVKVTIFPLYIPGISIYSAYGYGITNSLHMLIAVYGLLGALTSDTAFMLFVLHFISYGELFRIECEQFTRDLSDYGEQWEQHTPEYESFCRDGMRALYRYHQTVIEYLTSLQECYHSICVFQVASCSFSVMFNLFLALTVRFWVEKGCRRQFKTYCFDFRLTGTQRTAS